MEKTDAVESFTWHGMLICPSKLKRIAWQSVLIGVIFVAVMVLLKMLGWIGIMGWLA